MTHLTRIYRDEFIMNLIKEILSDVYQYHHDNTDYERFPLTVRKSFLHYISERIKQKIDNVLSRTYRHNQNNIQEFYGLMGGLSDLYNILADGYSKDLLVKIIAYRILGKERVKLPLNNQEYWDKRKSVNSLIQNYEKLFVETMNWKLSLFKLDAINYPIQIFLMPMQICTRFLLKSYEYNKHSLVLKAEEGDVIIDAGGCWGDTALYFASEVGKNGYVYTFEFVPANLKILEKNLNLNSNLQSRIRVINNAIWDKTGELLSFSDNGPGTSVRKEEILSASGAISTVTIDDFVEKERLQKVNFIKMDIEGAELNALKGSIKTLRRFRPKLAISLYHNLNDFITIPEFLTSLNLGYDFYLDHFTIHAEETVLFGYPPKMP